MTSGTLELHNRPDMTAYLHEISTRAILSLVHSGRQVGFFNKKGTFDGRY